MADEEFPLYPAAIYLPVLAGLAVILDIPPLIWHVRNRNLAAATLVAWVTTFNFFAFINSLLWSREDVTHWFSGHGLCDFEVYVMIAGWTGISTTLLCIMRGLAKVLDTKNQVVRHCRAQRIRQSLIDAAICWGPPILQLGLFDVVKVYRYFIYDISGCVPAIDASWVSFALIYLWPLIIDLVVGCYAVLVIVRLHRYRSEFARLVHSHNTTRSRFLRLFLLSTVIVLGILPTQAIVLYLNASHHFVEYSWSRNHDPVRRSNVQSFLTHGKPIPNHWLSLTCGFLLFLFFGLGTDASDMYRSWAKKLNPARPFFRRGGNGRNPRRSIFHAPGGSSSSTAPISPSARSAFSCKTYFTSSTRSDSTAAGKSLSLSTSSLRKAPPQDLLRASADTAPILPLHHHNQHRHRRGSNNNDNDSNSNDDDDDARALSTASASASASAPAAAAAPTIDTAIPTTPLAKSIRKASVGTLVEDEDDGATTACGSPVMVVDVDVEKKNGGGGRRRGGGGSSERGVDGLGIEMAWMASPRAEA